MLLGELNNYRQQEEEAKRKKKHLRNIFRFAWSIVWKIGVLAALTVLAVYLEDKCDSKIPAYLSMAVDTIGVLYTLWAALKKDKKKYLENKSEEITERKS